jgi:hypothetical protein
VFARSTVGVEKVTTPLAGVPEVVPPSVAPRGFASEIVTTFVAPATGFPAASSTVTVTAGAIATPEVALEGPCVKTSFAGVPAPETLKGALVPATEAPVAESVSPAPRALTERFENVATPFTAFTVVDPASVPGPLSARVIAAVEAVTVLPTASRTDTWTGGVRVARGAVLDGWTVKASAAGEPVALSKGTLVAGLSPLDETTSV